MRPQTIQNTAKSVFVVFALHVFASASVSFLINPVQTIISPALSDHAALGNITQGLRVLAIALLDVRALPGLLLGECFSAYYLGGVRDPVFLMSLALVNVLTCWMVFHALKQIRINAFFLEGAKSAPLGQYLLTAAVICAAANAFAVTTILESQQLLNAVTFTMAGLFIGNIVGFLMAILIAKLTLYAIGR